MLKTINISWKWKFNAKLRNKYTDDNIVKVSDTLIDNILVQFNGGICQLSRGILMRRNCEHIFPICFCFFLFFMKNFNHGVSKIRIQSCAHLNIRSISTDDVSTLTHPQYIQFNFIFTTPYNYRHTM